ncbi:N-substituted formamide deformylase [Defluviimonas aquaemixtae]|uniref:N-substituted formamide deformylase n=1 Tax=Albidovulum aquaemixtae TaxID=1542388 RepID=A0A2R8B2F7_9RHOB|nr:amidohydrolase [Defluviimonas aquaemixtae]SPH16742.1 N-substituted formamide deformylase [Defluviimonas aquaemixtae]
MTPDIILTNARILTMDPGRPRAEAVALGRERVAAIGARAEIEALAGPTTETIDCGGATLLPGFFESHLHLVLGGAELAHLQLGHVEGRDAIARAFRDFARRHPDRPLLMAQGGHYAMLDHPMTRHDLDAVIADRPIAIGAHDHHTVWANTAALKAAGILDGAKMPHGHEVVMGDDGRATGELREFEAFAPVIALGGEARLNLGIATGEEPAPWPDAAARAIDRKKVAAGLAHAAKHGVTSIVNMDGNRYTLELLSEMREAGELTQRVKVPFHFKPHMELSALDRAEAMTRDFDDDWLCSGFVKMFMDGVIDSGTAFRLDDYPGRPGHRSEPLFPGPRFNEIAAEIDRRGLQIAVHAIGDGAVRTTIDGYEAARKANGKRDSRHRIEHIEMIDPADIPRLGALGITASVQPPHAPGAMDFGLYPTIDVIGRHRLKDAYLCRTLAEAGAPLAFASDWPVTDISVLRGIHAALTRPTYEGGTDQRVALHDILRAYTAGGAWAAHRDHVTGTLRPGLAADIVVLSGDIETTPAEAVADMSVALTICGGRVIYRGEGKAA